MMTNYEPWPILMKGDEVINLKTAAYRANKSPKTIRNWCKAFGIGSQSFSGSPIEISAPGLEMVRRGDLIALELLRDGKRNDPRVVRYFEHLGLPI